MPFQWNEIVKDCVTSDGVAQLRCLPAVFQNIIGGALIFAGITALLVIIFAGFKFINSGGDPKQVEGARNTLTFAIAGLGLVLLSFLIINIIAYITNTQGCINKLGFTNCK